MKKTILGPVGGSLLLAAASTTALAGYADDRAEIENISVRYMIAVDAGDIDTVMGTWADDGVLDWVARRRARQGGDSQGDVRLRRRGGREDHSGWRDLTASHAPSHPEPRHRRERQHRQERRLLVRAHQQHAAERRAAAVLRALRRRAGEGERQVAVQEAQGLQRVAAEQGAVLPRASASRTRGRRSDADESGRGGAWAAPPWSRDLRSRVAGSNTICASRRSSWRIT